MRIVIEQQPNGMLLHLKPRPRTDSGSGVAASALRVTVGVGLGIGIWVGYLLEASDSLTGARLLGPLQ